VTPDLIPPELADLLVCTVCHGELDQDLEQSLLRCRACGRTYPVRDGIPDMTVPEDDPQGEA
jgi:uncharacterized protein YbaR (Trm112 family)